MGAWGTGLYSNDTAEDVRELCKEVYPFVSVDEGNRIIFKEYKYITESTDTENMDDDGASFWYALADWQWKHGILTETIKEKVIYLLKIHAGIQDWEEAGNTRDVKKRIAVLDKLLQQLQSPQPECKISKGRLKKPKHKPGEIIIFHVAEDEDNWQHDWKSDFYYHPFVFKSEALFGYEGEIPSFSAYNKYMAVLCIGSAKESHSQYLPDIYDENSVYVMYDYCSEKRPELEELKMCGFVPFLHWKLKDFNFHITDFIDWSYAFTTDDTFRKTTESEITKLEKEFCLDEVERYKRQRKLKGYFQGVSWKATLSMVCAECWAEKIYLNMKGGKLDTLLEADEYNPELLPPEELDERWHEWRMRLVRKKDE